MLTPRLFLFASASILAFLTTGLFGLQTQTPQTNVDDLVSRVQVLETQVSELSTRVSDLESQTPEPTEAVLEDESDIAKDVEKQDKGVVLLQSGVYTPTLADIETYPCEYDAFADYNVCNLLKQDDYDVPWEKTDGDAEIFVSASVIHPTDKDPYLEWLIGFTADDWLFLSGAIFLYDGKRYSLEIPYQNRYTDVIDGQVYEVGEVPIDDLDVLIDIIASADTQVRLLGDDYHTDRALSKTEKEILLQVLATYEQRGGQLPDNRDKLTDLIATE